MCILAVVCVCHVESVRACVHAHVHARVRARGPAHTSVRGSCCTGGVRTCWSCRPADAVTCAHAASWSCLGSVVKGWRLCALCAACALLSRRNMAQERGLVIISVTKKCLAWPSFASLVATSFFCMY